MVILGIETSCDETAASVIRATKKEGNVELLSNVVSSSLALHSKTGGIIPEIAAREQVKYIIPVIEKAISIFENREKEIDAIAVTVGPGLIGSLLVGVETARTFSYIWKKPLIPINHLFGHIYANWVDHKNSEILLPAIALVVSGGHTDLVLIKDHKDFTWLGGTRDDAAGEALDKVGRILGLSYPAGAQIEKLSQNVKEDKFKFPRPLIDSDDFDFSFSGLKTAVLREVKTIEQLNNETIANISFSLQEAIFDTLITKTLRAAQKYNARSILLGGGVAANSKLREQFELSIVNGQMSNVKLFIPEKRLCTDNAAMIAASAFYNYEETPWDKISANPELYFD